MTKLNHLRKVSARVIAEMLNISVSTNGLIIFKWKKFGTTKNHPWTGVPWKTSSGTTQKKVRKVTTNPIVSWKRIQDDLKTTGMLVTKTIIDYTRMVKDFLLKKMAFGLSDYVCLWAFRED